MRTLCVAVTLFLFAACAPKAGDSCSTTSDCGNNLACVSCNAPADAGMDARTGTCQHTCQNDGDCTGARSVGGSTPRCGQDSCGTHFCDVTL
jgi:hypothetical protein